MKLNKIFNELVKLHFSGKKGEFKIGNYDGKIAMTFDNVSIFFINDEEFILQIEKLVEAPTSMNTYIPDRSRYNWAELTKNILITPTRETIRVANDRTHAWIDRKYLKYFDAPEFAIADSKSMVLVYEEGELVGAVAPVRIKEEWNEH